MTVKEFLQKFEHDLPKQNNSNWKYEDYGKWQTEFSKTTASFHKPVKQSYFSQTNRLIENAKYELYYNNKLVNFAYLGLFDENDETEFCNLINKMTIKLERIKSEIEMIKILNFLRGFMDFLLHEYYPENDLKDSIFKLKLKIIDTNKNANDEEVKSVIRFINLML